MTNEDCVGPHRATKLAVVDLRGCLVIPKFADESSLKKNLSVRGYASSLEVEITRSQGNCEGARRYANTYSRGRGSSTRVSRRKQVSKYITRGGSLCYHQRGA